MLIFATAQFIDTLYHPGKIIRFENHSGRARNKRIKIKVFTPLNRR